MRQCTLTISVGSSCSTSICHWVMLRNTVAVMSQEVALRSNTFYCTLFILRRAVIGPSGRQVGGASSGFTSRTASLNILSNENAFDLIFYSLAVLLLAALVSNQGSRDFGHFLCVHILINFSDLLISTEL